MRKPKWKLWLVCFCDAMTMLLLKVHCNVERNHAARDHSSFPHVVAKGNVLVLPELFAKVDQLMSRHRRGAEK